MRTIAERLALAGQIQTCVTNMGPNFAVEPGVIALDRVPLAILWLP